MKPICIALFIACFLNGIVLSSAEKKKIQIGVYHLQDPFLDKGGMRATVIAALKLINNSTKILKDYELEGFEYNIGNGNNFGNVLNFFMNARTNFYGLRYLNRTDELEGSYIPPDNFVYNPVAVLGPPNSFDTSVLYDYYTRSNILPISFDAGFERLFNPSEFPYLVNIPSPIFVHTRALVQYLSQNNIRKIAMMYTSDASQAFVSNKVTVEIFQQQASAANIEIQYIQPISYNIFSTKKIDYRIGLLAAKERDLRVIITIISHFALNDVLCEAYLLGMYGSKYQFINVVGGGFRDWARNRYYPNLNCTLPLQQRMSKNFMVLTRNFKENDRVKTAIGLTGEEVWQRMMKELEPIKGALHLYHDRLLSVFDAILGFSLAMDKILTKHPDFLDQHKVGYNLINRTRLQIIRDEMVHQTFEGASGTFKLKKEGEVMYRDGDIDLNKIQFERNDSKDSTIVPVAKIQSDNKIIYNKSNMNYPIPRDRPLEITEIVQFPKALVIFFWSMSGLGILIVLILLAINIIFRHMTYIKLSSPNINSLTCVGSVLLYAAVICYGFDSRYIERASIALTCNVITFLLSMGFTLTFGSLFSKTWRIYRIFTRSEAARYVVIKDVHLFTVVFLMLVVDAVICFSWIFISPFEVEDQIINETINTATDTIKRENVQRCVCQYQTHFFFAIATYKGLLMVFGLFVAYETRKIKVEAINDSSHIGMAVYNVVVFSALGAIVVFSLYDTHRYKEGYIVYGLCILQITTVTICLVFVPKIYMLLNDYDDPNFKNGRPVLNPAYQTDSYSEGRWSNSHSNSHYTTNSTSHLK